MTNREYEALYEEYKRLDEQMSLVLKEQMKLLGRLKKVCPHNKLSEEFSLEPGTALNGRVCEICKAIVF